MKSARQDKILELIREFEIDTQEELAVRLHEAGFTVTQATVSRDIRALNLTKLAGKDGKLCYQAAGNTPAELPLKYIRVLRDSAVSVVTGKNIVILKTVPGMAMGAAAALDATGWEEILGCIGGDDTILCACPDEEAAEMVCERLKHFIGQPLP